MSTTENNYFQTTEMKKDNRNVKHRKQSE